VSSLESKQRDYYLDNLKIFLTILVIFHHAGQAYGPTGGFWQFQSSHSESVQWLGSFFAVNASFFMGLFFLIAGYFLPGSYDRKGSRAFLKDKLLRFGPPILLAFFVLVPLCMYFYYSLYSGNRPLSLSQYYTDIYFGLASKPVWFHESVGFPEMNFGHLWFVEHLLVYSLIYWLGRKFFTGLKARAIFTSPSKMVLSVAFLITVATAIMREFYEIDQWIGLLGIIQTEMAHLPQYVLLFITGIFAYRNNWITGLGKKEGYRFLVIGLLMAGAHYAVNIWPALWPPIDATYSIYESFMAVFLGWGLIVLFRENFNHTSPLAGFLAEHSYAAYIFHFPIVLALQYALDGVVILGALGKFLTVGFLAVAITYVFCLLLRKAP